MESITNNAGAEALANTFQVAELEPRLENIWGIPYGNENPHPSVPPKN